VVVVVVVVVVGGGGAGEGREGGKNSVSDDSYQANDHISGKVVEK